MSHRLHGVPLWLGVLACLALACGPSVTAVESSDDSGDTVVLELNGHKVTLDELEVHAEGSLKQVDLQKAQCEMQAKENRHKVLSGAIDQIVQERLIAEKSLAAGVTPDAWLEAERERLRGETTDEDVHAWFESNKGRLQGRTEDQIAEQIKELLVNQALYDGIREEAEIAVLLEPYRLDFEVSSTAPHKGEPSAPVTIVEWSDFECPYCQRVNPTLERVANEYEGKVKIVFRQYPLESIHPNARKAAQAALCAHDQDKFWEMHDLMFSEQKQLDVASLKDKASRLGLDSGKFDACLDGDRHAEAVERDVAAGAALGVSGTPAIFINGRPMAGAVPFEDMAKIIDEELELAKTAGGASGGSE